MPKVKKSNNSLFVAIPPSMAAELSIKEGDDLDFIKQSDRSFVVAKKADLLKLLEGQLERPEQGSQRVSYSRAQQIGESELELLKKLDTLRYNERTKEKVDSMLDADEKALLRALVERKFVGLFRKEAKEPYRYSIAKAVYDKFLYRKGKIDAAQPQSSEPKPRPLNRAAAKRWDEPSGPADYMAELETNGYIVLKSEADAASASAALEDSIKHGLVVGTRAFDKKFYIGLKGFINRNAPKIMKALDGRSAKADEIADELHMNYDGVKTVLSILAESGDVTEVRRDIFRLA
jgi:antitoxin component of MazEF toxin-antitoxin module